MTTVGVFDSGVGGLSVLHELTKRNPYTNFIYLADTARLPYGEKSPETLRTFSEENTHFLIDRGCDMVVIACHSATASAAEWLRERFTIPIIDVITPSIKGALKATKTGSVGVIGTRATIKSSIHEKRLKEHSKEIKVITQACPLLVPLIEECGPHHKAIPIFLREYLKPFVEGQVDTLILGCTHYPFLVEQIGKILGPNVAIIDAGPLLAEELILEHKGEKAQVSYFVTDDCEKFSALAKKSGQKLLGEVDLFQNLLCL